MDDDTDLGGPVFAFPSTRASLIRATGSDDRALRRQAEEALIAAYWKPVYKYIRCKWQLPNEDAKDLTQAFFVRAVEKSFLDGFDPAKARFRTFVRVCVDGFVANERRAAGRRKRGGGARVFALDFEAAEGELRRHAPVAGLDPDDYFRQEWVRGLFALAVEDLRQTCSAAGKATHFALFERYDLDGPDAPEGLSYAQLGQEFGLPVTQVTNYLAAVRRQFRRLILDRLRASTSSDEEYHDEVRRLLGGDVR